MIGLFRRYLETWYVRAFFLVMVASFVLWGVGDMLRVINTSTWAAKVGGVTIDAKKLDLELRRALTAASRDLPPGQEISAKMRRDVGEQTLQRMIGDAAVTEELSALRLNAPNEAIVAQIRTMPAFQGSGGAFEKLRFDMVLRNNGLTEAGFMDIVRGQLARDQLMEAVSAGRHVPHVAAGPIYQAQYEKRSADIASFRFAAMPEPPVPDDAAARRWYQNRLESYSIPELRRFRLIVLSSRTVAPEVTIAGKDVETAYEDHKSDFTTVARRSAYVISADTEDKANELAVKWRAGATWAEMEAAAKDMGAAAIAQEDATEQEFPDPDLAKAVFAAPLDTVPPPVKGALGWFAVRVSKAVEGGVTPFAIAKDKVKERLLTEKALELVYDRANKIDAQLANGTPLSQLAPETGVSTVTLTADRAGRDAHQDPVALPGEEEIRKAILDAAFDAAKGDPPHLTEVQTPSTGGSGYYALTVDDVTPSAPKPFEEVRDSVIEDSRTDWRRHAAEVAAAGMMGAVNDGKPFADAARDAGIIPVLSPLVSRTQQDAGLPAELHRVLFGLKKNEATMVETADGFLVATPVEIVAPDPSADPAAYEQMRTAVAKSVANDLMAVFADALRQRANPRINQTNVDQILKP